MLHSQVFIHLRDAIIAGSTGRMAMLLIYGGPMIGLPRIDVVSTLGSLAAPNKQDAVTLGGAMHFTMGIIFAIIYAALWSYTWSTGHIAAASGFAQVSSVDRNIQWITGDGGHLAESHGLWISRRTCLLNLALAAYDPAFCSFDRKEYRFSRRAALRGLKLAD